MRAQNDSIRTHQVETKSENNMQSDKRAGLIPILLSFYFLFVSFCVFFTNSSSEDDASQFNRRLLRRVDVEALLNCDTLSRKLHNRALRVSKCSRFASRCAMTRVCSPGRRARSGPGAPNESTLHTWHKTSTLVVEFSSRPNERRAR